MFPVPHKWFGVWLPPTVSLKLYYVRRLHARQKCAQVQWRHFPKITCCEELAGWILTSSVQQRTARQWPSGYVGGQTFWNIIGTNAIPPSHQGHTFSPGPRCRAYFRGNLQRSACSISKFSQSGCVMRSNPAIISCNSPFIISLLFPLILTPAQRSTLMVLKNVTIDNRDTNTIKYQGFWAHDGAYNATSVGMTGTLSSTNDLNANFTIDTRK